jgi:hypothetical protein
MKTAKLSDCEFDKSTGRLTLQSRFVGGMLPREVAIESHHTGRRVIFAPVQPGDPLFDQDCWDGEQCIYRPVAKVNNCSYLVIYHGE